MGDLPDQHALDRLASGFDLRAAAADLALQRGGRSVDRYARARERTPVALDRVSSATHPPSRTPMAS